MHYTSSGPPLLSKPPSCVTETAYRNKTSLPYISTKFENVSFVKFSSYFGIYYFIWNLNTTFKEYLCKNRDMISTFSRTGCVLYFANNRLARDLDNHLNVVVVHNLRNNAKRLFSLKIVQEYPKCWVVRENLRIKLLCHLSMLLFVLGNSASVL